MKNITNPDQSSLLLEDLIIWTNYEIEVAAYNGAGRGTYSHKVTEWTLQGGEPVPCCSPDFFLGGGVLELLFFPPQTKEAACPARRRILISCRADVD